MTMHHQITFQHAELNANDKQVCLFGPKYQHHIEKAFIFRMNSRETCIIIVDCAAVDVFRMLARVGDMHHMGQEFMKAKNSWNLVI
jgi:hypothetical protein